MEDINPAIRLQLTAHYKMFNAVRGINTSGMLRCNKCKEYKHDTIKYKYKSNSARYYNICPDCCKDGSKHKVKVKNP